MTDIVVLHHKIHGLDPDDYADTIRQARPDLDVVVARTPEEEKKISRRSVSCDRLPN
jgi:hypothetical protein